MQLLRRLPAVLLFLAVAVCAGSAAAQTPEAGGQAHATPEGKGHEAKAHQGKAHHEITSDTPTLEIENNAFFEYNFIHLLPRAYWEPEDSKFLHFYDVNLFQGIAVVLILLVFSLVRGSFGGGQTGGFVRVFRGWCHWLRDELVVSVMGKEEGNRFAPFFIYMFFFIAFMNLLGLIPKVGVTATATFYVTGAMALTTFAVMLLWGCMKQGPVKFFVNLIPHGLPLPVTLLMIPIELIGLLVKPFALMIRLFANMLAGHMVIYSFLGMIFMFYKMLGGDALYAMGTAIPAVAMSVFINIIEGFIALLQAYIFTYLSIIFVHQSMHPAH